MHTEWTSYLRKVRDRVGEGNGKDTTCRDLSFYVFYRECLELGCECMYHSMHRTHSEDWIRVYEIDVAAHRIPYQPYPHQNTRDETQSR